MDKNIIVCSICGNPTSFERRSESLPHEGESCELCDNWVCINCVDWEFMAKTAIEIPVCVECVNYATIGC